jgi:hypothetical protein
MAIRPDAEAARRRREAQFITPRPVSRSSYLYEEDRHYRDAVTVVNAHDVARLATDCILEFDQMRETKAAGASPLGQAIISRFEQILGHGYEMVIRNSTLDPNRRW